MAEQTPSEGESAQPSDEFEADNDIGSFCESAIARIKASLEDVAAGRVRHVTVEQLVEELYRP